MAGQRIFAPVGCVYCGNKGFAGRVGLYELLPIRPDWARAVAEGQGESFLVESMANAGLANLADVAIEKMLQGEVPLNEAQRVLISW
ncbi:MAG: hypothetical protein RQ715_07300 [Methylococcales bacterium]|nr:hypothetical protein [Methylococcales bacterium]